MTSSKTLAFSDLELAAPLETALDKLGYTTPTPIQQQAIPGVLKGRDLMGIAQTGTGKTAAFALPVLNHILQNRIDPPKRGARALVLAPTRELASQIAVSFRDYGRMIDHLSVTTVFGGVSIGKQIKSVARGNDILVATPGRLLDLVARKDVRLGDVEILVLDEADQMMDMGFIKPLRDIAAQLPSARQTLFFSATMTPPIKKLAQQFLTDPMHVSVTPPNSTADKVEQSVIFATKNQKQDLLGLTLLNEDIDRALVFTRTKHGADRVVRRLRAVGIDSQAIHGNKSQGARRRALDAFRNGDIKVLIATDIAARGIDIEGISHVINYEIPNVAEQYVHRIGRTARAGRGGTAIAFVADDERAYLKDIQKLLDTTLPVKDLPDNFKAEAEALQARPALPKPEKPSGSGGNRTGRGKNKRRKNKRPRNEKQNRAAPKPDTADAVKTPESTDSKPKRNRKPKSPKGSAGGKHRPVKTSPPGQGRKARKRRRAAQNQKSG